MRIVCFSDIHGRYKKAVETEWFYNNPADILMFAGDMQGSEQDNCFGFIDWVHELPYPYKVFTFGNHDGNFKDIMRYSKRYSDIVFLINETIVINGIKIYGSPYTPTFGRWYFMKEDYQLEKMYKHIEKDTNIILTHGPAYTVLDRTSLMGGLSAGSLGLKKRIDAISKYGYLKYHIFGHIHEGYGMKDNGIYTAVNCSICDERVRPVNTPFVLDYEI